MIDPAGLALENFDAVGAWRTRDGGTRGTPIDASGQLVDGTQVDGVVSAAAGAAPRAGDLRRDGDREAADLCARPRAFGVRHAGVRAIVRDARRETTGFRRLCLGSSGACRSRCASKARARPRPKRLATQEGRRSGDPVEGRD